jgi:hypothetical protein
MTPATDTQPLAIGLAAYLSNYEDSGPEADQEVDPESEPEGDPETDTEFNPKADFKTDLDNENGLDYNLPPPPTDHDFNTLNEAVDTINKFTREHGYALTKRAARRTKKGTFMRCIYNVTGGGCINLGYKRIIGKGREAQGASTALSHAVLGYSK